MLRLPVDAVDCVGGQKGLGMWNVSPKCLRVEKREECGIESQAECEHSHDAAHEQWSPRELPNSIAQVHPEGASPIDSFVHLARHHSANSLKRDALVQDEKTSRD